MIAAGEEVAEFVGKKNGEQREGEREAREESRGMLVKKFVGVDKLVERGGEILGIRIGELRACGEAGAKREQEQNAGEYESSGGRARRYGKVLGLNEGLGTPINMDWDRAWGIFWKWRVHEKFIEAERNRPGSWIRIS